MACDNPNDVCLYIDDVTATSVTVHTYEIEAWGIYGQHITIYASDGTTVVAGGTTPTSGSTSTVISGLSPNTTYQAVWDNYPNTRESFTTLADDPITATESQWGDLIDKVKTLQTSKVNAKKIQGSTSGVVYRKVTVVGGSSVYDGVGILLFSRQQRYLIDGMTATGYSGRCIEIGTNDNGTTATTSNRLINLKVYGVPESSRVEIYCRMSPYVYIDVHSTGTITIEESTESA